jgi:beta-barrel assembly-enhancing protease
MKKSLLSKTSVASAALVLTLGTAALPVPAQAFDWGSGALAVLQVGAQYAYLNKQVHYIETQGRDEYFSQIKEKYGVNTDATANAMLDRIMGRLSTSIAAQNPKSTIQTEPYQYFVNNDKSFNAFCTLGHNLSVNIGAFQKLNYDEDELAFVIGHELAHGEKKHPSRGVTRGLPVSLLAALYSSQNPNAASYIGATLLNAVGTAKLVTKPMEQEADKIGFDYAVGAGYNIGGGAALWQRILERNGKGSSGFAELFNDHPRSITRRDKYSKRLTKWSNNKVKVDKDTGEILVKGKSFYTPQDNGTKSGKEQAYLIAGNLAAVFHDPDQEPGAVTIQGGILSVGRQPVMATAGVADPEALASRLSTILNPRKADTETDRKADKADKNEEKVTEK